MQSEIDEKRYIAILINGIYTVIPIIILAFLVLNQIGDYDFVNRKYNIYIYILQLLPFIILSVFLIINLFSIFNKIVFYIFMGLKILTFSVIAFLILFNSYSNIFIGLIIVFIGFIVLLPEIVYLILFIIEKVKKHNIVENTDLNEKEK